MAGDTIKMKDLPVAESKTGFKVIGVDSDGKSKKLDLPDTYTKTESDTKYSTKSELATIGGEFGCVTQSLSDTNQFRYTQCLHQHKQLDNRLPMVLSALSVTDLCDLLYCTILRSYVGEFWIC